MKAIFSLFWTLVLAVWAQTALAQQQVFVQVEAYPNLGAAEARARMYDPIGPVTGFTTSSGWYAIALGPFSERVAQTTLNRLLSAGRIPNDSYLVDGSSYRQQFWPAGGVLGQSPAALPTVTEEVEAPTAAPATAEAVPAALPDETQAEARQSERNLTVEEREQIQIALQWYGFYNSGIDGAFGPGTRNAMAAWQADKGYDPTGILTTRQRTELVDGYRAVLADLGMELVANTEAGIEVRIPAAKVSFDRYEPPFVHYEGNEGVTVLLISQEGTEATLAGLYDIMQSLEIVPMSGERALSGNSFTLTGKDRDISSYTYAEQGNGQIKGFTVVWPAGDERKFGRVIDEMKSSFRTLPGVLDDTLGGAEGDQSIDLLAGLAIRRPDVSRSGFYVDATGSVLTTTDVIGQCTRFTIDEVYDAEVASVSEALGLAVLRPTRSLSPLAYAQFSSRVPRLQSEIAVSGYSYGGVLGAPTLTYGKLADLRGLNGEDTIQRLEMDVLPGDAGGPVIDGTGAVVGALLASNTGDRQLPEGVSFAARSAAIAELLAAAGIEPTESDRVGAMTANDFASLAAGMTVLVSCWN